MLARLCGRHHSPPPDDVVDLDAPAPPAAGVWLRFVAEPALPPRDSGQSISIAVEVPTAENRLEERVTPGQCCVVLQHGDAVRRSTGLQHISYAGRSPAYIQRDLQKRVAACVPIMARAYGLDVVLSVGNTASAVRLAVERMAPMPLVYWCTLIEASDGPGRYRELGANTALLIFRAPSARFHAAIIPDSLVYAELAVSHVEMPG